MLSRILMTVAVLGRWLDMKFIIKDWAGNHCFQENEFSDFESAWGFLYEKYDHLSDVNFDEQMCEYFVEEK